MEGARGGTEAHEAVKIFVRGRRTLIVFVALLVAVPALYPYGAVGYGRDLLAGLLAGGLMVSAGLLFARKVISADRSSVGVLFAGLGVIAWTLMSALPDSITRAELMTMSLSSLTVGAIALLAAAFFSGYAFGKAGVYAGSVYRSIVFSTAIVAVVYLAGLSARAEGVRFLWEGGGAYALLFGLVAVFAYILFRIESTPLARRLSLCAFFILILVTALSRPPLLLMLVGAGILAVELLMLLRARAQEVDARTDKGGRLVAFVVGPLLIVATLLGLFAHIPDRLGFHDSEIRPSFQVTYTVLLKEYADDPRTMFIGRGPASFGNTWWQYRPPEVNRTALWAAGIDAPYNFVAHIAALFGVPAALAFILALVFSASLFAHSVLHAHRREQLYAAIGGAVIGGLFLAYSFFYVLDFALLTLVVLSLGFLCGALEQPRGSVIAAGGRDGRFLGVLLVCAGVASAVLVFAHMRAYSAYESGLRGLRSQTISFAEAETSLSWSLSQASDPAVAVALTQLYWADVSQRIASVGTPGFSEEEKAEMTYVADTHMSVAIQAVALDTSDPEAYIARGNSHFLRFLLSRDSEQREFAIRNYKNALVRAPNYPLPLFLMGQAHYVGGNMREAREALRQALELKPDYTAAQQLLDQVSRLEKSAQAPSM